MNSKVLIALVVVAVIGIGAILLSTSAPEPITPEPQPMDTEVEPTPEPAPVTESTTIVDLAVATPDLSTLVDVVGAAGLVDILAAEGPFTVFAPTNEAFAAVPEETIATLLEPENLEMLQTVLANHVVAGEVRAADLSDGMVITTLAGEELIVSIADDGTVTVGDAVVTTADVEADNGVVHIISSVITTSE